MTMTDPISDMMTRIRNANAAGHEVVDIPLSNTKKEISRILKEEGFIDRFEVVKVNAHEAIRVWVKYGANKRRSITGVKTISRPGLRVYAKKDDVPRVLGGLGVAILSTSQGLMTDKEAKQKDIGGEVLCYIW